MSSTVMPVKELTLHSCPATDYAIKTPLMLIKFNVIGLLNRTCPLTFDSSLNSSSSIFELLENKRNLMKYFRYNLYCTPITLISTDLMHFHETNSNFITNCRKTHKLELIIKDSFSQRLSADASFGHLINNPVNNRCKGVGKRVQGELERTHDFRYGLSIQV